MSILKQRNILIISLLLFVIAVIAALSINILLQKSYVQRYIMKQVSSEIGCVVRVGRMAISLKGGLGISFSDVKISTQSGSEIISALKVRLHVNTAKLLQGKLDIDRVSFRNCSIPHNELILPFSLDNAEMNIDDAGRISINGTGLWGTSNFQADATGIFNQDNGGSLNAEVNVKTDHLDFSEIVNAQKDNNVSDKSPDHSQSKDKPSMALFDIKLHIDAASGKWKKLPMGHIEVDCAFRNGSFFINQSTATTEKAHLSLKGHVKPDEVFFSGNLKMNQYPAKTLSENLDIDLNISEGDIVSQGSFSMKGTNARELIAGLNGTFALQVSQGIFENDSVFVRILNLLDVKKLIFNKHRSLSKKGLRFNAIKGDINITNGTMDLEDFKVKSPLFNAVGFGTIDLPDETVDAIIGIEPLSKLIDLAEKIPLSGYVLSGRDKSLLTYSFVVKGPMSDPVVKYFSAKKLGKDTIETFKQLFLLPEHLLNNRAKEKNEIISK